MVNCFGLIAICLIGKNDVAIYATWLRGKDWGALGKNVENQANLKLFIETF